MTKFSLEKVKMSSSELIVLQELTLEESGLTQDTIASKTGLTIGTISKILGKLNNKALIYIISSPIKIYRLIPERKKEIALFLTGWNFGKNADIIIDSHYYVFIAEVRELPKVFLKHLIDKEEWIEFIPTHWKGAYVKHYADGCVKFHKTDKECKVIFYFKTFAKDPYTADIINTEKFLEKKAYLETRYNGLRIGNKELVAKCTYI